MQWSVLSVLALGGACTFQAGGLSLSDGGARDFSEAVFDAVAADRPAPDLASAPCPPSTSLVACYRFEGDVRDGSSFGNDATSSLVTYVNGPSGLALSTGITSSVRVADSPSLDVTTAYTIETWVRPEAWPPSSARAGLIDDDGQWGLFLLPAGEVRCTSPAQLTSPTGLLPLSTWTHVACTWDGTTQRIYRDGVMVAEVAAAGTLTTGSTAGVAIAGNSPTGDALVGALDELRVWNVARSAAEICADAGKSGC